MRKKKTIITVIICIILVLIMILSTIVPAFAKEPNTSWDALDISKSVEFEDYNIERFQTELKRAVTNNIYGYINDILKEYPEYSESKEKYIKQGLYADLAIFVNVDNEEEPSIVVDSLVLHIGDKNNRNMFPIQILDELPGRKVGEKFKVHVESSAYNTAFGGKKADYYITVNRIVKPHFYAYDNITDEYAKNILDFESAAHFKSVIEEEAKSHLNEFITSTTQEYILKQAKVKVTRRLIQQKADQYEQLIINQAFKGNEEEYIDSVCKKTGQSIEEYRANIEKRFERSAPAELLYLYIADKENIKIDNEKFEAYVKSLSNEGNNGALSQIYYLYDSTYEDGEQYLKRQYIIKEVIDMLNNYELDFNTVYEKETKKQKKQKNIHIETTDGEGYINYTIPPYSGFKSYMSYKTITNESSKQYQLQKIATSSYNGLRTINGRYLIAVGTHFKAEIGTYIDLVLQNGNIIPCIVGEIKSDEHTDGSRIFTTANNCCSEFITDNTKLPATVKTTGNVSNVQDGWNSPVGNFIVYDTKLIF